MLDIPRYFNEQVDEMRSGLKRGFTPPRVTLTGRDASLTAVTDASPEGSLFYTPFKDMPGVSDADKAALREQAVAVIRDTVQPAYRDLLTFMRTEYVPQARTSLAAYDLPDGKNYYQAKIREFTTLDEDPTAIHALGESEVKRLHAGLPGYALLVLDAAYAEYVARNDYAAGIELVSTSDNVVMTRTFSKIYGLANLRIGWAYAPARILDALNRVRGPFNVNGAAIAAGVAAIEDAGHVAEAAAHNARWLPWLSKEIAKLGIGVTPSVGNFLLLRFPGTTGKTSADADRYLNARGFVLRAVQAYGLPDCLRLTVGVEEANRGVVAALAAFMAGGQS